MILELAKAILADIKALPILQGPDAIAFLEDDADPLTAVFRADHTRLRIMVAATGHSRRQGSGPSTSGDAAIEVTVFEDPTLRLQAGGTQFTASEDGRAVLGLSLTAASEAIAAALHWRSYQGFQPLRYIDMQRADVDSSDFRMVISFLAQAALSPSASVAWGAGDATIFGEVISKTVTRAGAAVFEPNRSGDASFAGVRDRHFEIDLTCSAAISSEDDLPALGETFSYNDKTYTTTLSSITTASEDAATCRLLGRTFP